MVTRERWQLWGGFWATSLGTLASRVLGLVRDMATAALLGLGEGGVMDAFVVAFRVPNLLRRIFGEGALAASFLPVFTAEFEREPRRAWQLLSALLACLTVGLSAVALAGEAVCVLVWWAGGESAATRHLMGLTAVMLPYLVLICLAAQVSTALQARMEFKWPAFASSLLNVCWLAAVWGVAPYFATDKLAQAYVIAAAVLVSGVLQLAVQIPPLVKLGFRFEYDWSASRHAAGQILRSMLPIMLGMAVTQLNTLLDSLIAWILSADAGGSQTIAWLPGALACPMRPGAAAAIYFGERFYQLPIGLVGVAIATVTYPLLSRHAARKEFEKVGADLTLALRLVWFLALPASVGMMIFAQPLARLFFERGAFTSDDAVRAGGMIACYASGVWAYCAIPVLVRGYYAIGDRLTPARLGLLSVAVNLSLNLTLVWLLAERGLAVATAIAAALQVLLLVVKFSRGSLHLDLRQLRSSLAKCTAATAIMAVVSVPLARWLPLDAASTITLGWRLSTSIALCAVTYLVTAKMLGATEPGLLFVRNSRDEAR